MASQSQSPIPFNPSGFFVMRTPLLPFSEFSNWSEGLQSAGHVAANDGIVSDQLATAIQEDRVRLRSRLEDVINRPAVAEALYIASPSLEPNIEEWKRDPEGKKGRKIEQTLCRYFTRMSRRSTPFGLFAGCSVGTIAPRTDLSVPSQENYQRHTRLDMEYLLALAESLESCPDIRQAIQFFPNSSIYRSGTRLRYAESRFNGGLRFHYLVAVEASDELVSTIERASNGARLSTLAEALVDEEIPLENAEAFVQELIENQLLVSELRPPVTGGDSLDAMIDRLAQYPVADTVRACLQRACEDLNDLDREGLGQSTSRYDAIASQLDKLPAKVHRPRLFQVDMFKRCEQATLGQPVLDELSDGLRLLSKLAPKSGQDQFDQFRVDFVRRYGDRSVPLVQVLDEESGIGFLTSNDPAAMQAPLLRGIAIPSQGEQFDSWSRKHAFLYNKLAQAFASGAETLDLTEQDIDAMQVDDPASLPDAVAVMGTLIAESAAQVDNGDFQFLLSSVSGPSGARLLGRFCHGDSEIQHHVQQHLQQEESNYPDAVVAEVVHLPEGRVGNVLSRPSLRKYEIPFLGASGAPQESQIDIQDLFVSVEGGEVVLRSERLGRRVIPRLTSAHNFVSRSLCIYKFLCALQEQHAVSSICWNWGPLESCEFLPRVTLGRLVLARAQWTISREELIKLSKKSGKDLFVVVQSWRNFRGFPRHVVLKDGDNELTIDLENILSIETFASLVKDRGKLTLVEMFPATESCVGSDEGRFAHEMIIPFVRKREQRQTPVAPPRADLAPVARRLPPGSEWQYFNLFTGDSTADQLLVHCIGPVARDCLRTGACDQWHFIRYNDPQPHLRLRFHGNPRRLRDEVAPRLQDALQPYLDSELVWKIQQDTYEREIERYGGSEAIQVAERIFHADSEGALDLLKMCAGDAGQETRWKMTLLGMHRMLVDLGLDLNARLSIAKFVRDSFFEEFAFTKNYRNQLSQKYRVERSGLDAILEGGPTDNPEIQRCVFQVGQRSRRMVDPIADLRDLEAEDRMTIPISQMAVSLLHMWVNRMLPSVQRAQEMVLYDFLTRHYESKRARSAKRDSSSLALSVAK